ncbi:unnamed protein product [Parajaminaea phylloscopi]
MSHRSGDGGQEALLPPILRLPCSVRSLLRSTAQLPNLPSLIVQLVHNALDARATRIRISIDVEACSVSCSDNGTGFEASLLLPRTPLERYVTTKSEQDDKPGLIYGARGEALASMAAIGLLRIDTRLRGAQHAPWTVLKRGDRLLYSGPLTDADTDTVRSLLPARLSEGSRVELRDLYSDLPMRRPLQGTGGELFKEIHECKQAVLAAALREPGVSFAMDHTSANVPQGQTELSCPAASTMVDRFAQLRFPVSPSQCGTIYAHCRLPSSDPDVVLNLRLRGFFLFEPSAFRADQHIYLQGHSIPYDTDLGSCWASIAGDRRLSRRGDFDTDSSSLQIRWDGAGPTARSVHAVVADTIAQGFPAAQGYFGDARMDDNGHGDRASTRLRARAVFALDLQIGHDSSLSNGKSQVLVRQDAVLALVCREVRACQASKGLVPDSRKRKISCERSQSAQSSRSRPLNTRSRPSTSPSSASLSRLMPPTFKARAELPSARPDCAQPAPAGFIQYTDPVSKQLFHLDERTGNSYAVSPAHNPSSHSTASARRPSLAKQQPGSALAAGASGDTPAWLQDVVDSWTNPALPHVRDPSQLSIPTLDCLTGATMAVPRSASRLTTARPQSRAALALPDLQQSSAFFLPRTTETVLGGPEPLPALSCGCSGAGTHSDVEIMDSALSSAGLDRDALSSARIVAQLDRKYIVCLCPVRHAADDPEEQRNAAVELLLCIDQHAADERVRFERILAEYVSACHQRWNCRDSSHRKDGCGASRELKEPVRIELLDREADTVLREHSPVAKAMSFWGLVVRGESFDSRLQATPGHTAVVVTHVPEPVGQRLRTERALLCSVLRSFIDWCQAPDGSLDASAVRAADPHALDPTSWMSALRLLPPRLLDLFKSKACRGAIMFNDALALEQCRRLVVEQLSQTSFPFRCAHGRTSATVLCALPSRAGSVGKTDRPSPDWTRVAQL